METILIAGSGITGLSAAWNILKKAKATGKSPQIIVVEKEPRLGGKTQTQVIDGMILEEGPDSVIAYKPWAVQLAKELGLETVGTNPNIRSTYILHHGKMEQLPVGMQIMIPTEVMPFLKTRLLSPWGKLRAGLEPFMPIRRSEADESIGSFVGRRFGREVLENLAGPLMGGIYGGDFSAVSMKATFPRFLEMEQKGSLLLQGWRNKENKPKGPTGSAFVTVKAGLNQLVQELLRRMEGQVRFVTGVSVTGLVRGPEGKGYVAGLDNGERIEADAVVLALPAYAAASLVKEFLPEVATELNAIPYHNSVVTAMAFNRKDIDHPLNASGFLVPAREPTTVTASTWVSSKWPHSAPADKVLIRCFIGRGNESKDWTKESDETILSLARKELERIMGLKAEPLFTRVFKWQRAMPQYRVGHLDRMDRVDKLMSQAPGLFVAGAAFRGVGLPDCVREGMQAAEKAAKHLAWEA